MGHARIVDNFHKEFRAVLGYPETDFKLSPLLSNGEFYAIALPKEILEVLVITLLKYHWHIWLEGLFPARPFATSVATPVSTGKPGETVQKQVKTSQAWQGSLSWSNTLQKWILDMTVGSLWRASMWLMARSVILQKPPHDLLADQLVSVKATHESLAEARFPRIVLTSSRTLPSW